MKLFSKLIFIGLWYHLAEISSKKKIDSWGFIKNLSLECNGDDEVTHFLQNLMQLLVIWKLMMVLDQVDKNVKVLFWTFFCVL